MGDRVKRTVKRCVYCGKEFNPKQGRIETNNWCSRECFHESKRTKSFCRKCGKEFTTKTSRPRIFCSRECWGRSEKHPSGFKGDKHISGKGYVYVLDPNHPMYQNKGYKRVAEHRLVMEQKLGRRLHSWEIVHHKDTIKSHNDPDNLELWVSGHPNGVEVAQVYIDEIVKLQAEISTLRSRISQLEAELSSRSV